MRCLIHRYVTVDDSEHHSVCGDCFHVRGFCVHSLKACVKCGKVVGYGSHGKLSVVPDNCKETVRLIGGKC